MRLKSNHPFCFACKTHFVVRSLLIAFFLLASSLTLSAHNNSPSLCYTSEPGTGLLVSNDGGASFVKRNTGLPIRIVYPFSGEEYQAITSIGVDPQNPRRISVTTASGLYYSDSAGEHWQRIPLPANLNQSSTLTASAPSPHDPNHFLLGTSFTGFYETQNGGASWRHITENDMFSFLEQGAGFKEEISGLAYDPNSAGIIYFELGFGGGVYKVNADFSLESVNQAPSQSSWTIEPPDSYRREASILSSMQRRPPHNQEGREERLSAARGHTGIFLNPYQAQPERLSGHIRFLQEHNMDSVVVDFKDDTGHLTYNSQLELPAEIGAIRARFNASELISTLHENDIYIIARIVVFKDASLFAYNENRFALWDRVNDRPWGNYQTQTDDAGNEHTSIREHWVDGFSEEVWRYNIAIATELQELGVDEIQFDYIRFPSDGPTGTIQHRFARPGMRRTDALASFLRMARHQLHIPIGTDVFGFNAWYRTDYLGQNLEILSEFIDVVSPMYYPSHFSRNFHRELSYFDRAEFIYDTGSQRAAEMVGESVIVRPYVQAFLIGGELNFEEDQYTDYLLRQLQGVNAGPSSGFTLWNMSGRYYMATQPLGPYSIVYRNNNNQAER